MGRTLVLHPGALGDVLLAVPAIRALRAAASGDPVILAAQARIGSLLTTLGIVDSAVDFDRVGLDALFADGAAPERLESLLAGAHVVSWFGAGEASFGRRLGALAASAVISSSKPPPGTVVWQHLLAATEPSTDIHPISLTAELTEEGRRALIAAGWIEGRRLVMLHPGAGGVAKRWAADGFAAVATELGKAAGLQIAVHDGPADHDAVAALRARLPAAPIALAEPALPTLAGALAHVALWIGCDSGVTHLAAAVGTPTLALFARENLAWRPWSQTARTRVVETARLLDADVEGVIFDALSMLR